MISNDDYAKLPIHLRNLMQETSLYLMVERIYYTPKYVKIVLDELATIDDHDLNKLNQTKGFIQLKFMERQLLFVREVP